MPVGSHTSDRARADRVQRDVGGQHRGRRTDPTDGHREGDQRTVGTHVGDHVAGGRQRDRTQIGGADRRVARQLDRLPGPVAQQHPPVGIDVDDRPVGRRRSDGRAARVLRDGRGGDRSAGVLGRSSRRALVAQRRDDRDEAAPSRPARPR